MFALLCYYALMLFPSKECAQDHGSMTLLGIFCTVHLSTVLDLQYDSTT